MENLEWAAEHGLAFILYADPIIPFTDREYMVHLSIYDYPICLWHDTYFSQAVTSFGMFIHNVEGIEPSNRSVLRLWICCRDPLAIPENLLLDYDDQWALCGVHVNDWFPHGWDPNDDLDPDGDEQVVDEHINVPANPNHPQHPYDTLIQCYTRYLQRLAGGGGHGGGHGPAKMAHRTRPLSKRQRLTHSTAAHGSDPTPSPPWDQVSINLHLNSFLDSMNKHDNIINTHGLTAKDIWRLLARTTDFYITTEEAPSTHEPPGSLPPKLTPSTYFRTPNQDTSISPK